MPRKIAVLLIFILTAVNFADTVTTESLYDEMLDLERLTEFSPESFKMVQYSSYCRLSDKPNAEGWFCNADGFGNEPIPGFEKVLRKPDEKGIGLYQVCDIKKPGALVRFWSARMGGTIRMYLDNSDEPIFQGPAEEFFIHTHRQFAEKAGIDETIFRNSFRQKYSCYFPIPFEKRCKITWEGSIKDTHFYHLQARIYDENKDVKTFEIQDLNRLEDKIRKIRDVLRDPAGNYQIGSVLKERSFDFTLKPNEKTLLAHYTDGPQAIKKLVVKVQAEDMVAALRSTLLYIQFDDYTMPQVQAPIGDFFGAAPGIVPMNSLPLTIEKDGTMTCRFVMPYEDNVRLFAHNLGSQDVKVSGNVMSSDYDWNDDSMHFYARWRIDHDLITAVPNFADMPYLIARGKGRFVGTSLTIYNPTNNINGGSWWGEGDEKIFVDDDEFPSIFGTGSEDYFNYAWGSNQLFIDPYCGQPRSDGPRTKGYNVNYRFHILDDIQFEKFFAFYMELMHHQQLENVSYARISYYYGQNLVDDHVYITGEDVRKPGYHKWTPTKVKKLKEAIFYEAENIYTGENVSIDEDNFWSNQKLLVWMPEDTDERLELKFDVPETRKYRLNLIVPQKPGSGAFKITLQKDGDILYEGDNYNQDSEHNRMLRTYRASRKVLKEGTYRVKVIPLTRNKPIGFDLLYLKPLDQ